MFIPNIILGTSLIVFHKQYASFNFVIFDNCFELFPLPETVYISFFPLHPWSGCIKIWQEI